VTVLAIDPGRDTGWAFLDDARRLVMCGLGNPPDSIRHPVVIERPQVYRGRGSKGDPNDLITLAIQVGQYKERAERSGSKVELVLPHSWKGTVDPDILCRRVVASLSEVECAVLFRVLAPLARKPMTDEHVTSGKRHNVIDAVGLAIWSTGSRLAGRFTRAQELIPCPLLTAS
jgi:hypothetical protein